MAKLFIVNYSNYIAPKTLFNKKEKSERQVLKNVY